MTEPYDLIVVGGGAAGLAGAVFGQRVGARVLLLEKDRVGGDCTWTGCVPTKALRHSAAVAHTMRTADRFGLFPGEPWVNLRSIGRHVREIVRETYADATDEALRAQGIDVLLGEARFLDPHTLVVGDQRVTGRNVLIATGARAAVPSVSGIDGVEYHTSETIWDVERLPSHLVVIGGGPAGCEFAQAFRRLGPEVTLIQSRSRLLPRDEPEASRLVQAAFEREGIRVLCNSEATRAWQDEHGFHIAAGADAIVGDLLLVTTGRRPKVDGINLGAAAVAYGAGGIQVDEKLRTTQSHIFAAGDCLGGHQYTHYAGWQGVVAARNALLPFASRGLHASAAYATFTDPEVAHAGQTEEEARQHHGDRVETTTWPMRQVDRARAEVQAEGFIKLVHQRGRLLGATVVSARAGEMIQEWIYVLEGDLKPRTLARRVHVYPTYLEGNAQAARQFLDERLLSGSLAPPVRLALRLMLRLMRLRRSA